MSVASGRSDALTRNARIDAGSLQLDGLEVDPPAREARVDGLPGASDARLGKIDIVLVSHVHGDVLRFSNGLATCLSGDTGITADQKVVVRGYYHAKLAVMNIGDGYTTSLEEAAYVINDLVKPASVIPSHANEVGTVGGKVRPGSKTQAFIEAVEVPAHVPLSGKTMAFDAAGVCTEGCRRSIHAASTRAGTRENKSVRQPSSDQRRQAAER